MSGKYNPPPPGSFDELFQADQARRCVQALRKDEERRLRARGFVNHCVEHDVFCRDGVPCPDCAEAAKP